jgi:hypothetical protein
MSKFITQPERDRIQLMLIDEVSKGLDDVAAGRVRDARTALIALKRRHAAKVHEWVSRSSSSPPAR